MVRPEKTLLHHNNTPDSNNFGGILCRRPLDHYKGKKYDSCRGEESEGRVKVVAAGKSMLMIRNESSFQYLSSSLTMLNLV